MPAMKIRVILVFGLLLAAALAARPLTSGITYLLPSVAATPVYNCLDLVCTLTGYIYGGSGMGANCSPQYPCNGALVVSFVAQQAATRRPLRTQREGEIWIELIIPMFVFGFPARSL
jgi:hypothetical protein